MVRPCRGKLLTIALSAAAFLLPISGQEVQIRSDAAQPPEMKRSLKEQISDQHLAGMGAIVVRAESIVGIVTAGVRRKGENAPLQPDDLFHLGSNTKAITATMIARLVEAGRLSWTTTPLEAFPELKDTIHPDLKQITIEQLLSHHAGIPPYTEFKALPKLSGNGSEQRTKFAAWVLQRAPAIPPGTKGLYSNAGFSIAAAMAERIMGSSWETLVTSQVLEPLGIHAIYGWPLSASKNQPWGHAESKKGLKAVDQSDEASKRARNFLHGGQLPPYLLPAGGMAMSLSDYGRFLQMNLKALRGTEGNFLSVATVRRLHSSPMQDNYALGWGATRVDGVPSSTHAGSGGTFYAIVALQPGRDVGVEVVANSAGERSANATETVLKAFLTRYALVPHDESSR